MMRLHQERMMVLLLLPLQLSQILKVMTRLHQEGMMVLLLQIQDKQICSLRRWIRKDEVA
jgi:hypothetical protein